MEKRELGMAEIVEVQTPHWIYLYNLEATETKRNMEVEHEKPYHGTLGKYLFFSDDKEELKRLAKEILSNYNLYSAKVPKSDEPKPSSGFGFVLCVYDSKSRFKSELRQFADEEKIKYRYWKSDADTLRGKYSKQFLASK